MTLRVLIVDDEAHARSRLRTLLSECTEPRADVVAEAANAVQAVEQMQRTACDLILLDVRMPGVDGVQLASRLREMSAPPSIVFVTAVPGQTVAAGQAVESEHDPAAELEVAGAQRGAITDREGEQRAEAHLQQEEERHVGERHAGEW